MHSLLFVVSLLPNKRLDRATDISYVKDKYVIFRYKMRNIDYILAEQAIAMIVQIVHALICFCLTMKRRKKKKPKYRRHRRRLFTTAKVHASTWFMCCVAVSVFFSSSSSWAFHTHNAAVKSVENGSLHDLYLESNCCFWHTKCDHVRLI